MISKSKRTLMAIVPLAAIMVGTPSAAQSMTGKTVFQRCSSCHSAKEGAPNGIGPNLYGVADRPIGQMAGYRYSAALSKAGGRWNAARLDRFLTSPSVAYPGTKMTFPGLRAADERRAVIAYLTSLTSSTSTER